MAPKLAARLAFACLALMTAAGVHAQSLSFRDILQRPAIKADERIAYGTIRCNSVICGSRRQRNMGRDLTRSSSWSMAVAGWPISRAWS